MSETPQDLYARLDVRRTALGWPWWRVAAELDVSLWTVRQLAHGRCSPALRGRVEAWLSGGGDA